MAIAYKSQGAGVATEASGGALSPLCPATVDANDILIAHCAYEGTTTTPGTPSGWALLGGPYTIEAAYRHWIFGKIAAGTEDGAAVAFGTPAVTTVRWARVYSFSGWVSGAIADNVPAASFAHLSHATDPQMPTVTTTVAGALAVACIAQADDNPQASATGETGGDWVEAVAEYVQSATTPDTGMGIQTCTPTGNPGTVSGGSISTANDPCGVIGFEIRPSLPAITGSGSPDSGAASVDGSGVSGSTGSGTPDAQAAAVDGEGITGSTGTGALSSQAASVAGEGEVASSEVTGTGALASQAATVDGVGVAAWVGAGDLEAQAAQTDGPGVTGSTGAGALSSQAAAADGAGTSLSTGSGELASQAAQADGAGTSASTGSGALAAQAAAVDGDGASLSTGAGALAAQAAAADGSGVSISTGEGALVAQSATAAGTGDVSFEEITGSGDLVAVAATVAGSGNVIALQPPVVTTGGGFSVRTIGVPIRRDRRETEKVVPLLPVVGTGNLAAQEAAMRGQGRVSGASHDETMLLLLAA